MRNINDVAKEVITALDYIDNNFVNKIPIKVLNYLKQVSETSNYKVSINTEKKLIEQNISEESKDLIALMYYSYIADEEEKKHIKELWNINERKHQKELQAKYKIDDIFDNKVKKETNMPVQIKKESLLKKIIKHITKILKKIKI